MKVLLVSNQGDKRLGVGNPIMYRMKDALSKESEVEKVDFYHIENSLSCYRILRQEAKKYDIVHVHFGGLYALVIWLFLLRLKVKKVITFHGTDIHAKALKTTKKLKSKLKIWANQKASFLSIRLFDKCGFVAKDLLSYVPISIQQKLDYRFFIQPLGVDYAVFSEMDKEEAQKHLGIYPGKYALFSDVSNTSIKRRDIAENILTYLPNYKLLIMSGVKAEDVPYYINACDFALLTSDEEGSPNIIREVLSLNKIFFSVDVGDASDQLKSLSNSTIISRDPKIASEIINSYLSKPYTDYTRETRRERLDFVEVNKAIIAVYKSIQR